MCHGRDTPARCRAVVRSVTRPDQERCAAPGSARMTTRVPAGQWATPGRTAWRSRRATAWRCTELPTALLTTTPIRGAAVVVLRESNTWTTTTPFLPRVPARVTSVKSPAWRRRCAAANITIDRREPVPRQLGGKARTALGPTGRKNGAPSSGAHPGAKSVGLRPPTVIGLEGAPHALERTYHGAFGQMRRQCTQAQHRTCQPRQA